MSGYLGLTKSINDRQSATQELGVLERMEGRQQQEQNQEIQAQIMQDQMYQQMYQQADGLLGKDRKRINDQIKMAQKQVQGALDQWGGSKTKFLANGGMGIMSNMQSDILHSEQAERYKSNKENLARIMEIQEKGMGHLLSPADVKSVEDYHANEDGATIKYSGMMTEVEIPHDKFAAGTEINPYYIMNHNANMVKILGNYAKVYPDRPEPEMDEQGRPTQVGQAQILAFMKKMGYGGMGASSALLQKSMQKQAAAAKDKAIADKRTVLGAVTQLEGMMPRMTADQVTSGKMNEIINGAGGEAFRDLLGDDFKAISRRRGLAVSDTDIIGEVSDYFAQDQTALRGSKKLAITTQDQNKMITQALGVTVEDNKISGFTPDGDMFASDGTKISSNNRFEADDYGKDFEVLGMVTGFMSAAQNGKTGASEDMLLVDAYDDDGAFDKKSTDKLYEGRYGGNQSEARMGYFIALKGKDDDVIYKRVDMEKTAIRESLANAYGESNDVTDNIAEQKQYDVIKKEAKKMNAEQQFEFEQYKSETKEVFEDPMFKQEGEQFYGAGSGGQMNRTDMMKSFYMAYEDILSKSAGLDPKESTTRLKKQVDKDTFTNFMQTAGVVEDLKDYNKKPDEIISKFLSNMNKTAEPGSFNAKTYEQISQKWYQILNAL